MYWTGFIITALLLLAYCLLILQYRKWFLRLPVFSVNKKKIPQIYFSIIIPARNEETNILNCLTSVLQQTYPTNLFEVIVINDHSTDKTESIIQSIQQQYPHVKLITLSDYLPEKPINAYKKKAIEIAIDQSKGAWIVTTDADCSVSANWLTTLDAYIQTTDPVFIAAPVMFTNNHSFLSIFQLLDFISLQGITAAAVSAGYHSMCNGANIAYKKEGFYAVGKFEGINHIASGDDMLLMYKMKERYPGKLGYLFSYESLVLTNPMQNWKDFFNQRIRWASKADAYKDKSIYWVLALVYAVNAGLLILLLISPFVVNSFGNWLFLLFVKIVIELRFMIPVARFYKQSKVLLWAPFMQPFHITYTVVAGWLGKFGTYQWKGRKVR